MVTPDNEQEQGYNLFDIWSQKYPGRVGAVVNKKWIITDPKRWIEAKVMVATTTG